MAKKKSSHAGAGVVGVGLAVTTAVVAAAGTYFLYGSKVAAKNRKMVKGWALKAKGEVLEGLEKVKQMDEKQYHALVDKVMKKYRKFKHIGDKEAAELRRELKGHWREIQKHAAPVKKKVAKIKKTVRRVTKKVAPKKRGIAKKKKATHPKRKATRRKK